MKIVEEKAEIKPCALQSVMVRFFSNLFTSECPKCKVGRVRYIGDDWTGYTWISVYECKNCKTEFV